MYYVRRDILEVAAYKAKVCTYLNEVYMHACACACAFTCECMHVYMWIKVRPYNYW